MEVYNNTMSVIQNSIQELEKQHKIPREDASMLCPLGMTTAEVDKRNVRNLIDMSRNRECSRAFWEYRQLFNDVKFALSKWSEEWQELIDLTFYPKCVEFGYCPESKSCHRYPTLAELEAKELSECASEKE
jgi:thymidylate synthase (FAD)